MEGLESGGKAGEPAQDMKANFGTSGQTWRSCVVVGKRLNEIKSDRVEWNRNTGEEER